MYNQEIKELFLAEYTSGENEKRGCRAMFETISQLEFSINKDLAEMSKEEVICATRLTSTGTYKTAAAVQSRIKAYVRWCVKNAAPLSVSLDSLKLDIKEVDSSLYFSRTLFRNEDELIDELQSVRHVDEGFTEGVALALGWIGIRQRDMLSISINDVSLDNRVVYVPATGKEYTLSDKIEEYLRVYEKTKEGSRSAGGTIRPVFRDDSFGTYIRKYCPRGKLGEKQLTLANLKRMIGDVNSLYVDQGKVSRLWEGNVIASGALYRVFCLERDGVDIFSIKNKHKVIEAFRVDDDLHEILWMYNNYKKAFNL